MRIGAFAFPIRFRVTRVEEVELLPVTRSAEEAKEIALSQLGFYESDLLADATVRKRDLHETVTDTELQIRATFYCEEEIGIEMPISA